ncbi:MAG TPA: AMP-binding protein [Pseudonocardia sp.]|jgi:acyl-CoA synthetase (AMP-forming)/AMP-acid ligase II
MAEPGFDVETLHGRRATDPVNRMVVGDILGRLTWSVPDKEALVGRPGAYGDEAFARLTYRRADEVSNQVAHALLAAGLRRSDRVVLYCENSVEAVLIMIGIAKAGLVCVPVNPMLASDVLSWAIEHVGASYAVVDAELWPLGRSAFESAGLHPSVTVTVGGGPVDGTVPFSGWIREQPRTQPEPEVPLHSDDIWMMLFTSGTTALPKAAMCSHAYSYLAAFSYVGPLTRGIRHESDLRLATFLPIVYHCGHNAGVLPGFFTGGTVVLGRRFSPADLAEAVTTERVTALWAGAPRFLRMLADHCARDPATDLSSVTLAMFSWGAMHPGLVDELRGLCGDDLALLEVFGQSEAMSCFRFWLDEHPAKVASSAGLVNHVGVPNPVLAADIVAEDGTSLRGRPGVAGEAVYRSPVVASGYFRDEEATRQAFAGGWFHSGDSCMYEEDGQQILVDRYKDIIKTGGENVSSVRVEAVLMQHPAVERAAVVGLPDDHWGERVTAVVVRAEGADPDPDGSALIAHCRERVAGYETPKAVVYVDGFPETVGGKILKYRLREQLGDG